MHRLTGLIMLIILTATFSCKVIPPLHSDPDASKATKKAYQRFKHLSNEGTMIGYEDALAYGIGWRGGGIEQCDMYRASGAYPAVYGWDLGDIHKTANLDTVPFSNMIEWIKLVHDHGGINTISWHMDNPVNGNSSWDKTPVGQDILPGGAHHDQLLEKLDRAASFLKACKSDNSHVPIIFRPYHEHNGNWFWWGKGNLTEEEYIALFQFTADYLRKAHSIHHLIYAFSPDRSRIATPSDTSAYFYGYPGDEYVDLIGLDNYRDVRATGVDSLNQIGIENLKLSLEMITDIAEQKGKIAALTETGSESITDEKWFTQRLLKPLLSSEKAQRLSYILTWRNANTVHHYMTYPGHLSQDDFKDFISHPHTLSLEDIGRGFKSVNK